MISVLLMILKILGLIILWTLIIVLALVIFGGSKVAGLGGALGKSIKDFKQEVKEDDAPQGTASEKNDAEQKG